MSDDASDQLSQALERVYAVGLDDFMSTRSALVAEAKAAGDKALAARVGGLRKPSIGAWAVNLVARQRPEVIEALLSLGARMRAATSAMDTGTLRSLRGERDAAIAAFVDAAVEVSAGSDRTLSAAGQDEVRATAIAALADEAAAGAVASGQLTKPLSYSGFGEVDLSDAVVRTSSGTILSVIRGGGGSQPAPAQPEQPAGPEGDAEPEQPAGPEAEASFEQVASTSRASRRRSTSEPAREAGAERGPAPDARGSATPADDVASIAAERGEGDEGGEGSVADDGGDLDGASEGAGAGDSDAGADDGDDDERSDGRDDDGDDDDDEHSDGRDDDDDDEHSDGRDDDDEDDEHSDGRDDEDEDSKLTLADIETRLEAITREVAALGKAVTAARTAAGAAAVRVGELRSELAAAESTATSASAAVAEAVAARKAAQARRTRVEDRRDELEAQ